MSAIDAALATIDEIGAKGEMDAEARPPVGFDLDGGADPIVLPDGKRIYPPMLFGEPIDALACRLIDTQDPAASRFLRLAWRTMSMSSSPATGPSAEPIRYTHGSTRIGRTCTPCATPMFPATLGSTHRRTARTGCPACMYGNYNTSPEDESATGRPDRDGLTGHLLRWQHVHPYPPTSGAA